MRCLTLKSLSQQIEEFLVFKRALGYRYQRSEATLRSFERFVRGRYTPAAAIDLAATVRAWLLRSPTRRSVTLACDLGVLRQFCQYRRRYDSAGFVPPIAWAPCTESRYQPYVFSHDEIRALLHAASRHRGRNCWSGMVRMLLLTAYCTGLRFGEAARLQLTDLDLERGVLSIRESKGRSRRVSFQPDLAREFRRYLPQRARTLFAAGVAQDPGALFVGCNGRPITLKSASEVVRRLLRRIGLKSPRGRSGPRPYDLRHAFAVHRLTAWYEDGLDIHARLPWLSAYMGHLNMLGTEVYLHATPELLRLASDRFDQRLGHREPVS